MVNIENTMINPLLCKMRLLFFILLFTQQLLTTAQNTPTTAIVRDFIVEGNQKTKFTTVTRELTIGVGDTIPLSQLAIKLEENRLRLLGTGLFNDVKINVKNWTLDDKVSIVISISESWYFYPVPIIELADRDFNVWWKEYHHDLRRTNYGVRLVHSNFTGRRDAFSTLIQFGYTPKFSLGYNLPYLNKKQTIGAYIGAYYATNREVGYKTDSNRVVIFKNPLATVLTRFSYNASLNYVPGLYDRYSWSAGYSKQTLDTAVTDRLNRDYFLDSRTSQTYFWASFDYATDTRDFKPYPTKGHTMGVSISKLGLFKQDNVNALNVSFNLEQYVKISQKWCLETVLRTKANLIRKPMPYNFQRAIGYGSDYLRGYELFVVDGSDFGLLKNSLRYELFDRDFDYARFVHNNKFLSNFTSFSLKVFLSGNFDIGYAYTPQYKPENNFNNRLLYGGGIGLNVLAYHSMLWQLEYSFNHTGKGGFFVHYKSGF